MKYIKSILTAVIVLGLTVCMFSCSDKYDETIISDVKLYDTMWTLPERRVSETSSLFPAIIDEKEVVDYYCKHSTYQMVGTGWQVELTVKYSDELFSAELERLNDLCSNSVVCGESEYFDTLSYASVWNWNGCFEYAVADEKEKTIGFIYLQLISKDNLEISSRYIPNGYEMNFGNSQVYTIYQ